MVHFADMTDEERIRRLEHKVAETRKMLFGALLLAKDTWQDELSQRGEGIGIMEGMEKAEESFTEGLEPDRFKRLEHAIDVIEQRAKSIFDLMSYMSKYKKT
jgi:predicted HTH transcriptional regulator